MSKGNRGGPRPKPSALKLIEGSRSAKEGKYPVREDEPLPEGELARAPDDLTPEQVDAWDYAIENAPKTLLRKLDRDAFKAWVVAVCEQDKANAELAASGEMITVPGRTRTTTKKDGSTVVDEWPSYKAISPWTTIRDRAFLRMMKAVTELGFSPTSRTRIVVPLGPGSSKAANRFASNAAKTNRRT